MILSKTTGYGIRALAYLARKGGNSPCQLQEIAEHEHIPKVFLQKILGELRRHRVLRSATGIHGGYELDRPAASITLWEVFILLEPDPHMDTCILGRGLCDSDNCCGLHHEWVRMRAEFIAMLKHTTIELFLRSDIDATSGSDQGHE